MAELWRTVLDFANLGLALAGVFVFSLIVGLLAIPFQRRADRRFKREQERVRRLFSQAPDDA